jgi:hypothetical protein
MLSIPYLDRDEIADCFPTDKDWEAFADRCDKTSCRYNVDDLTVKFYKQCTAKMDSSELPSGMAWQYLEQIDNPLPDGIIAQIEVKHD